MFEKSQWIWENENPSSDEYAEFGGTVRGGKGILRIAAETDYAAYVNGKLAAFGSYKGFKTVRFYDEILLDPFLTEKENEIDIVVWYQGVNCSSSIDCGAGVLFEIAAGGKIVGASGKNTPSRIDTRYKNHYRKRLTPQLGFSFLYDVSANTEKWGDSTIIVQNVTLLPRPVEKLVVSAPAESTLIGQEGGVYLFDLHRELAGQLYLDFVSEEKQKLTIAYGEHIVTGGVSRVIGNRDFSVEYIAKEGRNEYVNPFRRLGLRYLEVHAEKPIKVNKITILPVCYPLKRREFIADTPLHEKITNVAATFPFIPFAAACTSITKIASGGNRLFIPSTAATKCFAIISLSKKAVSPVPIFC